MSRTIRIGWTLVVAAVGVVLVWDAQMAEGTPATSLPTPSPTPGPTVALNADDWNAFAQLSTNLNRASWRDCNKDTDPCTVCSMNTNMHGVECSVVPVASEPGKFERRITGMYFRNLNIKGSISDFVLHAFTALRTVDLSNNISLPWGNRILPAFGESCVEIPACEAEGAFCVFGPVAPRCSLLPATSAPTTVPEPVGTYIGIAFGVIGGVAILSLALLWWSQKERQREAQEERERARRRRRHRGDDDDDDNSSVYSRATVMSVGSMAPPLPAPAPPPAPVFSQPPPSSNRKSFSSLRTRKQKELQKQAQQQAMMMPQGPGWTQQADPATGAPYWFNTMTGEARSMAAPSQQPGLTSAGSSRRLVEHGSSKKLVKKGSAKDLKRTGSKLVRNPSSRQMSSGAGPSAPPPLSVGPLAAGEWEQAFDPSSNANYWVNRATGQFSWTQPF